MEKATELQVTIYDRAHLDKYVTVREKETKIGQVIPLLESTQPASLAKSLADAHAGGARYAIILVAEDIGPRANFGRPGANDGPQAFLHSFLNMQSNRFLNCSKLLLIGELAISDLQETSQTDDIAKLRELCAVVDNRLSPLIREIALAGLEAIVIGGGNNNSFPTIEGVVQALRSKEPDESIAVVNCDPHADFRPLEGRHSGNPFSYARDHGYLSEYCIFGMHESYNSAEMLERLQQNKFLAIPFENFAIKKTTTFEDALCEAIKYLVHEHSPVGLEVDLDSIKNMPASAETPFGISEEQAAQFVHSIASQTNCRYLLLSEGAPSLTTDNGARRVGKCLALLVATYIKARETFREFW